MRKGKGQRNILSIEAAVGEGSLALLSEGRDILLRREGKDISRAERIVPTIVDILQEAALTVRDVDMIAVSTGPGSYSGIRIGLATALGLANSLDIPCVGVLLLDAMAHAASLADGLIVAVPVGKNDVAYQPFEMDKHGDRKPCADPELLSSSSFVDALERFAGSTLFAQTDLLVRLNGQLAKTMLREDAGRALAEFVGRFASFIGESNGSLQPIYLRSKESALRPGAI